MTDSNDSKSTGVSTVDRRTALRGSVGGLAAIGLGSFVSNTTAHHQPGHSRGDDDDSDDDFEGGNGANDFRFAGEEWHILRASSESGEQTSPVQTLLQVNDIKQSNSWQDSLVLEPSVETSLLTNVSTGGNEDRSRAVAGVLAWVEIRGDATGGEWQMVTVDDQFVEPPGEAEIDDTGGFVGSADRIQEIARSVVSLNSRDLEMEWDLEELVEEAMDDIVEVLAAIEEYYPEFADYQLELDAHDSYASHENWLVEVVGVDGEDATSYTERAREAIGDWREYKAFVQEDAQSYEDLQAELLELDIFLEVFLTTKSAHSFNWIKTNTGGTHDARLRGALHVFVDDDDDEDVEAQAIVGNRTMLVSPVKTKAAVSSRDK